MRPQIREILDGIKEDQKALGFDPDKIYIVFSKDKLWLNDLYEDIPDNIDIRTVSEPSHIKAILDYESDASIVIDCNGDTGCAAVIAIQNGLLNLGNEIFFAIHPLDMKTRKGYETTLCGKPCIEKSNIWGNITSLQSVRQTA
jgi:hypothetical protein